MPLPTPAQITLQDAEIGFLYHLDLTIYREDLRDHSAGDPAPEIELFNPRKLDTDQWLAAAHTAGAKYAIFTASHETGFMNWSSDLYPYGVKQSAWREGRGDIVGDFVASCHKYGIAPGLFIGLRNNCWWNVDQYKIRNGDSAQQAVYNRVCEQQVKELCTRYGPLFEIWIEGGVISPAEGGPDILPIIEKHQPNTIFYHSPERGDHRWVGNENGHAGYPCWSTMPHRGGRTAHDTEHYTKLLPHGDREGEFWAPAMCDVPLRNHSWFWHPHQESLLYSTEELVEMYDQSVGRNAILTIGAVVDPEGLVPEPDAQRCADFGAKITASFAHKLAETSGTGNTIELKLSTASTIDRIVIMEDISQGERIRSYRLEAKTDSGWKTLCDGISVGHKRIQKFPPVSVEMIRLVCTKSSAEPLIRSLAVYEEYRAGHCV